jgi:hypothetical protein
MKKKKKRPSSAYHGSKKKTSYKITRYESPIKSMPYSKEGSRLGSQVDIGRHHYASRPVQPTSYGPVMDPIEKKELAFAFKEQILIE